MIVELRWKRIELSQFLPAAAALGGYGAASRELRKLKIIQKILPAAPTCPAEVLTKAEALAEAGKSCQKIKPI